MTPTFWELAVFIVNEMACNLGVCSVFTQNHRFDILSLLIIREEIVIWVRKKTGAPVTRLSLVTEAEEFLKNHQIFVIGVFENYEVCDLFRAVMEYFKCFYKADCRQ